MRFDDMLPNVPISRRIVRCQYEGAPGHGYKGAPMVQCLTTLRFGEEDLVELRVETLDCTTGTKRISVIHGRTDWLTSGGWIEHAIREIKLKALEVKE